MANFTLINGHIKFVPIHLHKCLLINAKKHQQNGELWIYERADQN